MGILRRRKLWWPQRGQEKTRRCSIMIMMHRPGRGQRAPYGGNPPHRGCLRLRALSVALGMRKCEMRNAKLKSWPCQLAWQRRACSPASGRTCLLCPDRTPRCQQNHAQVMQSDVMPHLLCSGILPTLGTPALTRRNSQDCVNQIKFSPCSAGSEHGCP